MSAALFQSALFLSLTSEDTLFTKISEELFTCSRELKLSDEAFTQ